MVATTTLVLLAGLAGALLVGVAYLLYSYGQYTHSRQPGVVDLHDYQDTRLQIISSEATENLTDDDN